MNGRPEPPGKEPLEETSWGIVLGNCFLNLKAKLKHKTMSRLDKFGFLFDGAEDSKGPLPTIIFPELPPHSMNDLFQADPAAHQVKGGPNTLMEGLTSRRTQIQVYLPM